tara:strand:+ start:61 stop:186 length:126 start_codon:yes stop_codon:yes gene_type:complete
MLGLGLGIQRLVNTFIGAVGSFIWGTSTDKNWGESTTQTWG